MMDPPSSAGRLRRNAKEPSAYTSTSRNANTSTASRHMELVDNSRKTMEDCRMRTENIPRKLYTTQLCRKDENGVIKFVAPNEVSRLATQEEFDKALANLNYKNPLIATWDSFEEAQHFAAKYGSFGTVHEIITDNLADGHVYVNPLNPNQYLFNNYIPPANVIGNKGVIDHNPGKGKHSKLQRAVKPTQVASSSSLANEVAAKPTRKKPADVQRSPIIRNTPEPTPNGNSTVDTRELLVKPTRRKRSEISQHSAKVPQDDTIQLENDDVGPQPSKALKSPGRPKRARKSEVEKSNTEVTQNGIIHVDDDEAEHEQNLPSTTPKKQRGRPRKSQTSAGLANVSSTTPTRSPRKSQTSAGRSRATSRKAWINDDIEDDYIDSGVDEDFEDMNVSNKSPKKSRRSTITKSRTSVTSRRKSSDRSPAAPTTDDLSNGLNDFNHIETLENIGSPSHEPPASPHPAISDDGAPATLAEKFDEINRKKRKLPEVTDVVSLNGPAPKRVSMARPARSSSPADNSLSHQTLQPSARRKSGRPRQRPADFDEAENDLSHAKSQHAASTQQTNGENEENITAASARPKRKSLKPLNYSDYPTNFPSPKLATTGNGNSKDTTATSTSYQNGDPGSSSITQETKSSHRVFSAPGVNGGSPSSLEKETNGEDQESSMTDVSGDETDPDPELKEILYEQVSPLDGQLWYLIASNPTKIKGKGDVWNTRWLLSEHTALEHIQAWKIRQKNLLQVAELLPPMTKSKEVLYIDKDFPAHAGQYKGMMFVSWGATAECRMIPRLTWVDYRDERVPKSQIEERSKVQGKDHWGPFTHKSSDLKI